MHDNTIESFLQQKTNDFNKKINNFNVLCDYYQYFDKSHNKKENKVTKNCDSVKRSGQMK